MSKFFGKCAGVQDVPSKQLENTKSKLHILFVWPYLHYPEVALEFLEKIKERGHKVSVLLAKGDVDQGRFLDSSFDFHFAYSLDIVSKFTKTPYPILKCASEYVKAINPDVIHVNSHLFLSNYQILRAAQSMGIPSVVTVHGFSVDRSLALNALQKIYLCTIGRSGLERASAIVCLTRGDAASVASILGNCDKIFVIPNGVDTALFQPASVKDPRLITWVGRLVPEKGLVYLLMAMRRVVRYFDDVRVVLVGDGPQKDELMELVDKMSLHNNVVLLGAMSHKKVAKILSKSSIFVFPSLKEGMPMALLEAMACALPVVGFDIPGVNSLVKHGHNGLLVSPKNSVALANAILTLLGNDELRRVLGANGRRVVIDRHSWSKVIKQLDEVYHFAAEFRK